MKEIVNRLQEKRNIELAKSILESQGYRVSKKSKRLKESVDPDEARAEIVNAWSYGWQGTPQDQNNSHRDEEYDIYQKYGYDDEYYAEEMSDDEVLSMYDELAALYESNKRMR